MDCGTNARANSALQKNRCQQEIWIHPLFFYLDFEVLHFEREVRAPLLCSGE